MTGHQIELGDRLTIGTAGFGDWVSEAVAQEIIDRSLALGIRRFDTAPLYGRSEEILGAALNACNEQVRVGTKISFSLDLDQHRPVDEQIIRLVERSLIRLKRGKIDLLQVHDPVPEAAIEQTFGIFEALRRDGLVGDIGLCNYSATELETLLSRLPAEALVRPVEMQICHNLLSSDFTPSLSDLCEMHGIAVWAWSPLAGGLLAGGYRSAAPRPPGSRAADGHWLPIEDIAQHLSAIEQHVARNGPDASRAAMRFVLQTPGVRGAVFGPSKARHLELIEALATLSPHDLVATTT